MHRQKEPVPQYHLSLPPGCHLYNLTKGFNCNQSTHPSLGRVQRKAWEWAFLSSAPFFLPLKGGLGHFLPSSSSQKPLLSSPITFLLWSLPPPQTVGRWSVQAKGDTVRATKLSFFPSCLSVSLKKKIIFQCLSVGSSRSLTLTRNQKD